MHKAIIGVWGLTGITWLDTSLLLLWRTVLCPLLLRSWQGYAFMLTFASLRRLMRSLKHIIVVCRAGRCRAAFMCSLLLPASRTGQLQHH